MIGLVTEVGKRVSGRWTTAILLPGLLVIAVGAAAVVLRHTHAFDLGHLAAMAERVTRQLLRAPGLLGVTVAVVLVGAGLIGSAATATGRLVQRWWLREWSVTRGLATRSRWSRRSRAAAAAVRASMPTVAAYLPQRPTWFGDRVRLVETRVQAQYHVSAALVWPRLWLLLDEDARRPVTDARIRYTEAVTLVGWGVLYLAIGALWWPALFAGACMVTTGWYRARHTLAELAELVESAIDLRLRDVASALGLPPAGTGVSESEGRALDDQLGKSAPW